jgi:hypothetical protein
MARAAATFVGRALVCLPLALGAAPSLQAQADWSSVHQAAVWLNAFVDHAVSPRAALWFDGHWRRDGLGAQPQQLLLRPGVQVTLRPGWRLGAGYAYIATAPYGESPNGAPLREHRAWQQLSVSGSVAGLAMSHRLRWEERWIGAVDAAGDVGPRRYQTRVRYLVRGQRALGVGAEDAGPVVGFVANEFFLPLGHSDGAERRLQNRAQIGVGVPLSARQRVELSYLHQWNRITPRTTHEMNHTVVASWIWTSSSRAPARVPRGGADAAARPHLSGSLPLP